MNDLTLQPENEQSEALAANGRPGDAEKAPWETPVLEDVSEQVMAQPYIRFT
jgi:hypothetical protein